MEHTSIWSKILTVIGFIFVASLLMSILGGIIGFALHVLIPMALVVWLVRYIFSGRQRHYYR
ncbi:hypothetical protein [Vagococcus salmoninarum]|uniref:Uncharacterized protein n=1 Tax=Vagococcus salmoninarum TaxID=2739 RepID=A0A429ZIL0_9ENTE|nr:hypothetical protein [Vagococcus salmoninarum]MBE9388319.1 hypothetical protein [Vagococcus salmoninarum]RST93525.1 hypothetical protein CBF35_11410 [Vagococcus salmoninarum]